MDRAFHACGINTEVTAESGTLKIGGCRLYIVRVCESPSGCIYVFPDALPLGDKRSGTKLAAPYRHCSPSTGVYQTVRKTIYNPDGLIRRLGRKLIRNICSSRMAEQDSKVYNTSSYAQSYGYTFVPV